MTIGTPQPHRGAYALVELFFIAIIVCVIIAAITFWRSSWLNS